MSLKRNMLCDTLKDLTITSDVYEGVGALDL
jgi:hypothetical protein